MNKQKIRMLMVLFLTFTACGNNELKKEDNENNKPVIEARTVVEGRFVKMEKSDSHHFDLYIALENDSIVLFKSLMPIDEAQASMLKKDANNVRFIYQEHSNPVTQQVDKNITWIDFIYDLKQAQ